MVGKIFDIISDAKTNRAKAEALAEKYGVDPQLKRGEFLGRSVRDDIIRNTLGNSFVPRTNTRDLISRGQSTPFASPLASDYFNRGQSSPLPMAVQKAAKAGQPFPNVAVGAPLSSQVRPQTPAVPSSSTAPLKPTTSEKPVKVKDAKLGKYLAEVIKSLNATLSSINERLDDAENDVIQAKEGVFGTVKQLEQNSDLLETKLDAIIDALRNQNNLAKLQEDKYEINARESEQEIERDLSDTRALIKPEDKKSDIIQLNLLEDIKDSARERDEQLSLPFAGGSEGFEGGGIASGPDSGYLAKLHGDEMIVPLDNNYTQGEPSAVDGKVRKPPMLAKAYETGTKSPAVSDTPLPSMGPKIFEKSVAVDNNIPDLTKMGEDLQKAMEFPVKAAGIITMNVMQEAVSNMGGLAGGVAQQLKEISSPLAAAFGVSNTITNSLIRGKSAEKETEERQTNTRRFTTSKKRAWWDPLGVFTGRGEGGGRRYGTGGPGLSYGGARAGFTGMRAQGFNAISGGAPFQLPKPTLFGRGSRPLLGKGAYVAPTMRGANRYVKPGGGIIRSITPGGATGNMFIDMIEPQRVVQPKTFDKGRVLAEKILSNKPISNAGGAAGTSALRQRLAQQLTSGQGTQVMSNISGLGRGAAVMRALAPVGRLLGKLSKVPLLSDMLFPESTAVYDQVTGPNAMYNDPKLSEKQRLRIYESIHGPTQRGPQQNASVVESGSKNAFFNKMSAKVQQLHPIFINNQTAADSGSEAPPMSHISNMGDPGFGALFPSPY